MKKIEIFGKKVPLFAILIALLVIGTASAAVFLNYATLTGDFDVVGDGISVTDSDDLELGLGESGILNFSSPATFTINNDGTIPVIVDLVTTLYLDDVLVTDEEGLTVDYSVFEGTGVEEGLVLVPPGGLTIDVEPSYARNVIPGTYTLQVEVNYSAEDYETFTGANEMETIVLSHKTLSWDLTDGKANIEYAPAGNEFYYEISFEDVTLDAHALIYYADKPNRFEDWGGNNPGAIIQVLPTAIVDGDMITGCIDLGMDLPHINDANYDTTHTNYCDLPDEYDNCCGAKLQIIPIIDLTPSGDTVVLPLIDWDHVDRYLLETDLIQYTDTDL